MKAKAAAAAEAAAEQREADAADSALYDGVMRRAMRRVAVAGRYWNHPSDAEGKGELR